MSREFSKANTGVIWDMNECPVPFSFHSSPHPYDIYAQIASFLASKDYKGNVEVFGFELDFQEEKEIVDKDEDEDEDEYENERFDSYAQKKEYVVDQNLYDYHAAGIFLERGDPSAIANKKIVTVLSWALDNPQPANLVVISEDIAKEPFLMSVLRELKGRNYNILLVQDSSTELVPAGSIWRWEQVFEEEIQRIELSYEKRVTTVLGSIASCNTGVFWDVDDCSIPHRRTLGSIRQGIVNCIHGYGGDYRGEVTIRAYASNAHDVTLGRHRNSVYNCGARYRTNGIDIMVKDILLWALDNLRQPSSEKPNLLIIAKDVSKNLEFKAILHDLLKKNINVVLALPEDVDEGPKVQRLLATNVPLHEQNGY